ncbi:D-cysteine desulfhydrase [Mesorhizobium sp. Z1-4]|uniref:D-cysteine desulfhydrase n=1 Tax=Mesorhizobium sp. Z1-4 TaxID=2448478 RepID=UPI001FE07364|nr:D-cysteine desulfhydrase [Mesorhizobium sp. Z1-4]
MMSLAKIDRPRLEFCHIPTPLEPLPRLTKHLGGPNIFVKRDDCTGLAGGGNKSRKLEYIFADVLKAEADVIVTQGDVQSNHVRQTSAAAARFGIECHGILGRRVEDTMPDFQFEKESGNVFLDNLFGAHLHYVPGDTDMDLALQEHAEALRRKGRKPYIIPGGGNTPLGAMGYVRCAHELLGQARDINLEIDHLVHTTGGTTTQVGLLVGLHSLQSSVNVYGVSSSKPKAVQEEKMKGLCADLMAFAGIDGEIPPETIVADSDFIGPAYGVPAKETIEAIELVARLEGILLDPVYTGKSMAGLIALIRRGHFKAGENVVYLHTGGTPALFAYTQSFDFNR